MAKSRERSARGKEGSSSVEKLEGVSTASSWTSEDDVASAAGLRLMLCNFLLHVG